MASKFSILLDLVSLPPKVFAARMAKRFLGKKETEVHLNPQNGGSLAAMLSSNSSISVDQKTKDYLIEKFSASRVDVLGSGWFEWKGEHGIRWQHDPVASFDWNIDLPSSSQLGLGLSVPEADVKRPWELARFQHFTQWLAITEHKDSGNQQIADEFQFWVEDFLKSNPIGMGVHWMNAMEVAIRAMNWMVITDIFRHRGITVSTEIETAIRQHIDFVFNHLERKEGLGNNHYLANLVGLLFGLIYFPDWKELHEKSEWITDEFTRESKKQFYSDGGNFEGSMYYHKLGSELLILGTAALSRLGHERGKSEVGEITQSAMTFMRTIVKPNGELPDFGDNDSGSIFSFSPSGEWTTAGEYIQNGKSTAAVFEMYKGLIGEGDSLESIFIKNLALLELKEVASPKKDVHVDKHRTFKHSNKHEWVLHVELNPTELKYTYFPITGIVVCKSDTFYLAMSLLTRDGAHRYRGHFHNDQLSVEIWANGKDLVLDPGTYTYTGDMEIRNAMRSAKAHNGPYWGVEPNPFLPGLLGLFHQKIESKCELLEIGEGKITALLSHRGFEAVRDIHITENGVRIIDSSNKPFEVNEGLVEFKAVGYGRRKVE
ncbi:MAG: heparinase II/III family protein [Flavobacteriia bacterium]|nr:heparinase II/III family protein [Flavobacteriia bacterium]